MGFSFTEIICIIRIVRFGSLEFHCCPLLAFFCRFCKCPCLLFDQQGFARHNQFDSIQLLPFSRQSAIIRQIDQVDLVTSEATTLKQDPHGRGDFHAGFGSKSFSRELFHERTWRHLTQ